MSLGNIVEKGLAPVDHLAQGLPLGNNIVVVEVLLPDMAVIVPDNLEGKPRQDPDVPLPQARIRCSLQVAGGADDPGGGGRPAQIAGIEGRGLQLGDSLGQEPRLPLPQFCKGTVGGALKAFLRVPMGLSVADQEQIGHAWEDRGF